MLGAAVEPAFHVCLPRPPPLQHVPCHASVCQEPGLEGMMRAVAAHLACVDRSGHSMGLAVQGCGNGHVFASFGFLMGLVCTPRYPACSLCVTFAEVLVHVAQLPGQVNSKKATFAWLDRWTGDDIKCGPRYPMLIGNGSVGCGPVNIDIMPCSLSLRPQSPTHHCMPCLPPSLLASMRLLPCPHLS